MTTDKALVTLAISICTALPAFGQRGGPDWTTTAGDPQRTSWVRADSNINADKENNLGIQKLWALKMPGTEGKASEPIMISTYIGYRGFKALAVVTGSNYLYTADYDLGRFYYDHHYGPSAELSSCTAWPSAVGKLSSLAPVAPRAVRQTNAYHTVTGLPHEGVPLDAAMGGIFGPGGPGAPQRAPAPAQLPPGIRASVPIFLITSDGMARAINFDSGKERYKPVQFLPAGSAPFDLIVVEDTLYAATRPGCGGSPNSIFALDVSSEDMKPAGRTWKAPEGNVLGAPAFNKGGTLFVSTDKGVYALKPKTLDSVPVLKAAVTSTPVIITGRDKEWLAVGTREGIALMDASGSTATTIKSATSGYTPTALATWDDKAGNHWLLATDDTTASGAIHAYKVTDSGLELAWTSQEIAAPSRPIIVDGIVFALATGATRNGGTKPATEGTHATLYALDGVSGKALWNSGSDISSFVSTGGLSFNEGQVYLTTYDNTLYAFGKPEPHQ